MTRNRRTILSLVAILGLAFGSWMVLSAGDSAAVREPQTQDIVTLDEELSIETADFEWFRRRFQLGVVDSA